MEPNVLFYPQFIHFLQSNFMPYIFIWSGFVCREINHNKELTRLTQGVIEKFFGTKKNAIKQPLVPARFVISSLKSVLANCAIAGVVGDIIKKEKPLVTVESPNQAKDIWHNGPSMIKSKNQNTFLPKKRFKKSSNAYVKKKARPNYEYQQAQKTLQRVS